MQLFYSRRIGLSPSGQPLPLLGGVRLSGRTGPYTVGVMNIQQRASGPVPANNYTVARVRRDLRSKVDFGGLAVYRRGENGDYNAGYGVDFNATVRDRLTFNAYHARTQNPGVTGRNAATQGVVEWDDGFVKGMFLAADIGERFDPQVGFVPRRGIRNYQVNFGLQPRPRHWRGIREINPHTNVKFFTDRENELLTRDEHYAVAVSFNDGGRTEVSINPQYERLTVPFRLPNGVTVPVGDYHFREFRWTYASDKSRLLSASSNFEKGGYYDGHRTRASVSTTVVMKPRLATDVNFEYNLVSLPRGTFRADLYGVRSVYSFTPQMFADAYVQYNTSTKTTLTNLRFNFTYRPLSDFIIVYNETLAENSRDTWRAFIIKFTRMLQF